MPKFKDQAICIRHHDWSETSQVVALLTREHGKVRGIAKGSRRMSPGAVARFSGGIELLTRGEVVATNKLTVELATITEWDLQDPYRHLRTNLAAQELGLYGADLVNALVGERDAHPGAFAALARFLEGLAEPAEHGRALLAFQWRVLEDAGYRPEIDVDVRRGTALPAAAAYTFYPHGGGVSAEEAGVAAAGAPPPPEGPAGPWRVRGETVELLRAAARGEEEVVAGAGEAAVGRANRLLCFYARTVLERELPTMEVVIGKQ